MHRGSLSIDRGINAIYSFIRLFLLYCKFLPTGSREEPDFYGFLYRTEDLRHSYEKFHFAGNVNKPPFEEVYNIVKAYIYDALPKESKQ